MSTRIDDLATQLAAERDALGLCRDALAYQQERHDQAEVELFDALEQAGLRSVRIDGLGTFSLNDLAWAKITNPVVAREWALENLPEAITLNHNRLTTLVRLALKGEGEIPPGVDWTASRKVNWRKA